MNKGVVVNVYRADAAFDIYPLSHIGEQVVLVGYVRYRAFINSYVSRRRSIYICKLELISSRPAAGVALNQNITDRHCQASPSLEAVGMRIGVGRMRVPRHIVINVVRVVGAKNVVLSEEAKRIGIRAA